MIAGSLQLCGAWLGYTVPGGGKENPEGFFENVFLREAVNKKILAVAVAAPLGVQSLPLLDKLPTTTGLGNAVKNMLDNEGYDYQRPWAFKEPKLCLLWPRFAEEFPQAHWIIVRRKTEHIVASCLNTAFMNRQNNDTRFWFHWAEQYLQRIEALKQSTAQWSEIWSQPIIDGDLSALKIITTACGLNWRPQQVSSFIKPDYWHF